MGTPTSSASQLYSDYLSYSNFMATANPSAIAALTASSTAPNLGGQDASILAGGLAYASASSSAPPKSTDNAQKGNNNNGSNATGLVNYYFVFIALIFCVVALFVFLVMRRKHRAVVRQRMARERALSQDLGDALESRRWEFNRRQRWYRQGRWRSAEASREEGLNELGEAPPAYMPKRPSEEVRRDANVGEGEGEGQRDGEGPAIPLQTLSRDDVGLKPPDYSETQVEEHTPHGRSSVASASSSRTPETRDLTDRHGTF